MRPVDFRESRGWTSERKGTVGAIFVSHSSHDDAVAREIGDFLQGAGHWTLFLDSDPAAGIAAGQRWERELHYRLRSCQSVVVLCSPASMASRWVFVECSVAKMLGKLVIPVRIAPCEIDPVLTEFQVLDFETRSAEAYQRLLRALDEAGLDPRGRFRWDPRRTPYPGWRAFERDEAAIFFGRDDETHELRERLRSMRDFGRSRALVVLGASGSGKSSLVRAGVLPNLELDEGWYVVQRAPPRPRREPLVDPFDELARWLAHNFRELRQPRDPRQIRDALAGAAAADGSGDEDGGRLLLSTLDDLRGAAGRPEARVLLVIDPLESLLTRSDPQAARRCLALLHAALADPGGLLVALCTLRSDNLSLFQKRVAPAFPYAAVTLRPLAAEQWARVIEGPAEKAGLRLEPGLVPVIVQDCARDDALPVLAFTLNELWERFGRDDGELTVGEYRDGLGGLAGAVGRVAERVFEAHPLAPDELAGLRSAFVTRLVTLDEQGQPVRQPARWAEVPERAHAMLERLVKARLLASREEGDEEVVVVAHESLFRSWVRLREWLVEDRDFILALKRLRRECAEWEQSGRMPGELLQGSALLSGRYWLAERPGDLSEPEHEFVRASVRAEAQRQRRRRLSRLAAAAAVAAVPLLALLGWRAQDARQQFRASALVSAATLEADPVAASLILAELLCEHRFPASVFLCHREPPGGAAIARQVVGRAEGGLPTRLLRVADGGTLKAAAFLPVGVRLVATSDDGTVRVWQDALTEAPLVLSGHSDLVSDVAFGPDGSQLLTGSLDGSLRLWQLAGGEPRLTIDGLPPVVAAAFSPDGQRVAAGLLDGTVRLWLLAMPQQAAVLGRPDAEAPVVSVGFSPDGARLVSSSTSGAVRVWPLPAAGQPEAELHLGAPVYSAGFSPDGSRIALSLADGTARACTPALTSCIVLGGHAGPVWSTAFSPDGTRLVTTSEDETARVWRLEDGTARAELVLQGHGGGVTHADFGDGEQVLTLATDQAVRTWRVGDDREPALLRGHRLQIWSAAFSPDGARLLTASEDGTVRQWHLGRDGGPADSAAFAAPVQHAAYAPDGGRVAVVPVGGVVQLCAGDLTGCRPVLRHEGAVRHAAFSRDGSRLVAAADDGRVLVGWSDLSREPLLLGTHTAPVRTALFSPDGAQVLTASLDSTARVWRLDRSAAPLVLQGHAGGVLNAAFSPGGSRVATASLDSTARLWRADRAGAEIALFRHPERVLLVAFSPDGTRVATAAADGGVRLWEADRQGQPLILGRHGGRVHSLDFSPDGSRLATAADDGTARVWPADGQTAPLFLPVGSSVQRAVFSPDGRRVATVSDDARVRLWRVDWQELLAYLRAATTLCLSPDQRTRLLNESADAAREAAGACERRHGRASPSS